MRTAAPLLLLALAVAGCGGGGGGAEAASVGGTVPSCVGASGTKQLSSQFPADFPLPTGAVVDREYVEHGARVAELYIRGGLEAARDYYREQLPKNGFELGEGDAEEEEAETEFNGHGYDGRLKLHTVVGCDGALSLGVVLRQAS